MASTLSNFRLVPKLPSLLTECERLSTFENSFHDGGRRGDEYFEEFRSLLPTLRHGSIVMARAAG